jgi:uncharacterized membrane protein (UPF0127 family)
MRIQFQNKEFQVTVANTFWSRFKGLMGQKSLPSDGGLLLKNCSSIHCFFMKMTIDVIYLDKYNKVVFKETVKPWHIGKQYVKHAKHVLEVPENASLDIAIGEVMTFGGLG